MWTRDVLAGAVCGVAAFISWFKPKANWQIKTMGVLLTLAEGPAGVELGFP